MAKTRNQTRNSTIKKEEEEDRKPTLVLGNASNTRNEITKRKPSKRNNRHLPVQQVKVEDDSDTKALLKSTSNHSKLSKRIYITQEQINQLIDAIVNDNMSVRKAASTVKISIPTARYYYNQYKNDPDKKMPLPQSQLMYPKTYSTPEQVENLIRYIVDDKMSISKASAKANLAYESGRYFYKKYLDDPDHAIPVPSLRQNYIQDQINPLIGYIVNNKMSITAASKQTKMTSETARKYYHQYFKQQHPNITAPSHIIYHKPHTQEQKKEVINCIIGDKMTIVDASKKANMSPSTAGKHYRQYLKDNNMEIPVSNRYTQDKINEFIGYIVDDKMNIKAASKKANIPYSSGHKYFQRYVNKHNLDMSTAKYGKDKINEFIGYIVEDKMSIKAASKKANMSYFIGRKHYRKYLMDHNLDVPTPTRTTQDQKKKVISYIVDDKMSITTASKKANISYTVGYKCYRKYLNNQKRSVSTRPPRVVSASKN